MVWQSAEGGDAVSAEEWSAGAAEPDEHPEGFAQADGGAAVVDVTEVVETPSDVEVHAQAPEASGDADDQGAGR
jgi:hypothetical protein